MLILISIPFDDTVINIAMQFFYAITLFILSLSLTYANLFNPINVTNNNAENQSGS